MLIDHTQKKLTQHICGLAGELEFVQHISKGLNLNVPLDCRILAEVTEFGVLLQGILEFKDILLNCFEVLGFDGGRVEGSCVTSVDTKELSWWLK